MEARKEILPNTVVTHSPGLVTGDMDGEKVMLNIEKSKYYALDPIASRIWELIQGPSTARDMVSVLIQEYNVDEKQCEHDVLALLNKLYDQGLINIA